MEAKRQRCIDCDKMRKLKKDGYGILGGSQVCVVYGLKNWHSVIKSLFGVINTECLYYKPMTKEGKKRMKKYEDMWDVKDKGLK